MTTIFTQPTTQPITYPLTAELGSREDGGSLYSWEKTLWPNFPATEMASGLRVANVTSSGSGATLSDVTGPNGELGVRVTMGTGTFRLSFPQNFDIDLTQGNIEIDMRLVSNTNNLGVGSAVSVVVSSGSSAGSSDVLASNNNRSVAIESKMRIHSAGLNGQTVCVPGNRISVVAGTGADMQHITGVRLGTNRTAAAGAVFDVFGWRYRPNPRINDITPVIFRFDGFSDDQYNIAFDKLKTAFGATTCKGFFVGGKRFIDTPNFLTTAQILEYLAAGAAVKNHGGFTLDTDPGSVQGFYDQLAPHRDYFRQFGVDHGYIDMDHWSSFFTWYNTVTPPNVNCKTALLQYRLAMCGMQFTSATGAPNPAQLGGAAFPPSRWNMECFSANSWDAANGFALDQDAIDGVTALMDAARANRSYVCIGWHAMTSGDRSDKVLDTMISKIAAEPTNFAAMLPYEMLDPYRTLYGGVV